MLAFGHNPYDGRIYHREAKSLAKYGYSVSILSLYDGKRQETLYENINVRYIKAIHKNIYILWFIKLYMLFREALKINADIYHCHEPQSFMVGIALKILKGKKLIHDVHEYYPDDIENAGRFYKYYYMFTCYVFEPLFCWMADYIICADDEIRQLYRKFNKKVVTLFNYPLTSLWEEHPNAARETHRTKDTLIYAGLISELNGIWAMLAIAVELVKQYKDLRLLLIGDISFNLKEKIDNYIQSNNLEGCVKCIGNIPHHDVAAYLKTASLGLLLYNPIKKYCKNIPTKQYEYAVSELPYVGTDLPPIKKFIDDAKCGLLVPPYNIEETVKAVNYILTHPDEAKKMGENGRKAVYEKYNWGLMEKKLLEIYSRLK